MRLSQPTPGQVLSKVPQVTLAFWVIKIFATTLGETGGDAVTMTLNLGYATGSLIFLAMFAIALTAQLRANRYHPFIYWSVVVATTTVGTTMSDFLDRTLALGYVKSSVVLFGGVLVALAIWRRVTGKIEYEDISTRSNEFFYWLTILISNTLGTALGDFTATTAGLGFEGGALLFSGILGVILALSVFTKVNRTILFWAAYVLTRPLGATVGDVLTKPFSDGGFNLDRFPSSLVIGIVMVLAIWWTSRPRENRLLPA